MFTLPNILTLGRLCILPLIIILLFIPAAWAAWTALILYLLGALSDFLDGWIARRFDQESALGAMMDPIADKIYTGALLITFIANDTLNWFGALLVICIFVREFAVSGLREYLGPRHIQLPVTKLAKWKTATQMAAVAFLIVAPFISYGYISAYSILVAAAAVTLYTGWEYLRTALDHILKIT